MATKLYHEIINYDYPRPESAALMKKVWSPTPWAIKVRDFEPNSTEWFEFCEWADENLGTESWPIHNRPGDWYRAGATIFGVTYYGFRTEELMKRFMEAYPDRVIDDHSNAGEG